ALGGQNAQTLIEEINEKTKKATEVWNQHVQEQSKQAQILKSSQGRLYELEEHSKSIDIHFTQELHTVQEISALELKLKRQEVLPKLLHLHLTLHSPHVLFTPLLDLLKEKKDFAKKATDEFRMNFATVSTRLKDWE